MVGVGEWCPSGGRAREGGHHHRQLQNSCFVRVCSRAACRAHVSHSISIAQGFSHFSRPEPPIPWALHVSRVVCQRRLARRRAPHVTSTAHSSLDSSALYRAFVVHHHFSLPEPPIPWVLHVSRLACRLSRRLARRRAPHVTSTAHSSLDSSALYQASVVLIISHCLSHPFPGCSTRLACRLSTKARSKTYSSCHVAGALGFRFLGPLPAVRCSSSFLIVARATLSLGAPRLACRLSTKARSTTDVPHVASPAHSTLDSSALYRAFVVHRLPEPSPPDAPRAHIARVVSS